VAFCHCSLFNIIKHIKTTLIRKLILEDFKDEKVVVKEITAGCICCSLSGNFDATIIEILESLNTDRII